MLRGLWNLAEGILKVLLGLSLFTLVFICIIPAWPMEPWDFRSSCSGFFGDKFLSLSLTGFCGQIRDLCNCCFVGGDFALLVGVIFVWEVDPMCVFAWTSLLDFFSFLTWVGACRNSSECSFFFRCSWNFGQLFSSNWINFSTRALYLFSWQIVHALCATNASVSSSKKNTLVFLTAKKDTFLLRFPSNISFSFFITVVFCKFPCGIHIFGIWSIS